MFQIQPYFLLEWSSKPSNAVLFSAEIDILSNAIIFFTEIEGSHILSNTIIFSTEIEGSHINSFGLFNAKCYL